MSAACLMENKLIFHNGLQMEKKKTLAVNKHPHFLSQSHCTNNKTVMTVTWTHPRLLLLTSVLIFPVGGVCWVWQGWIVLPSACSAPYLSWHECSGHIFLEMAFVFMALWFSDLPHCTCDWLHFSMDLWIGWIVRLMRNNRTMAILTNIKKTQMREKETASHRGQAQLTHWTGTAHQCTQYQCTDI